MVSREEFDGVCIAIRLLLLYGYEQAFRDDPVRFEQAKAGILAGLDSISFTAPGLDSEMVKHNALHFAETVLEGVATALSGQPPRPKPDGPVR